MGKLGALFDLFRKGSAVADPALWKTRQITVTLLGGVIMAAVHVGEAYGLKVPVTSNDVDAIAGTILFVVNLVLTPATSEKVGLPPRREDPPPQDNPVGNHTD